MKKSYIVITFFILVALLISTCGCTISEHDTYKQVHISTMFCKTTPMALGQFMPSYLNQYYDYYITDEFNGAYHVSKDVYSGIRENHTYVLRLGYVDDFSGSPDYNSYGYVEIIKELN